MTKLIIRTTQNADGWLDTYKDGQIRRDMADCDVEVLENALPSNRKKYIKDDAMIIEAHFETKRKALICLSQIRKLETPNYVVTVDVVE